MDGSCASFSQTTTDLDKLILAVAAADCSQSVHSVGGERCPSGLLLYCGQSHTHVEVSWLGNQAAQSIKQDHTDAYTSSLVTDWIAVLNECLG